jgi:DNA modification methylase
VFEPFGGSGTTLIACEKAVRTAYLMELDPIYCDVIIKRWQAFTGKQATLETTGQIFDELAQS